MSLYAEYIMEIQGKRIIEDEISYATYYPVGDGMYIEDIYVKPEYRAKGIASKLADQIAAIAIKEGYHKLYGSVRFSNKTANDAMKTLLAYGFCVNSSTPDGLAFVKGIS